MLFVEVVTESLTDPNHITQKVIDHDEHDSRVWLGRHCFWAMRNGFAVHTRPLPPAEG